jgi:hypothetical protein
MQGVQQQQQPGAGAGHTASLVDHPPPHNIAQRRDLRNFESRQPPTDFETWEQAANALRTGQTVKEIVYREFARSFGGAEVQCVPLPAMLDHVRRAVLSHIKWIE